VLVDALASRWDVTGRLCHGRTVWAGLDAAMSCGRELRPGAGRESRAAGCGDVTHMGVLHLMRGELPDVFEKMAVTV